MKHRQTEKQKEIAQKLSERMKGERPEIGPELVELMADWSRWMRGRGASAGTGDWHVSFLRWALGSRAQAFVTYCRANPGHHTRKALSGIERVYRFYWPHRPHIGYFFHGLWGWLQLELEKPGEYKPPTPEEQRAKLEKELKEEGIPILGWTSDGFGGVQAITGPGEKQ